MPSESLAVRVVYPAVNVTTMLVRRRHRSLRPCAQVAWSQFVAEGTGGGPSRAPMHEAPDAALPVESYASARAG